MSEILTKYGRIIERLSMHNNLRFDRVSWPGDGHECPSYMQSFRRRTQNLPQLQHDLKSQLSYRAILQLSLSFSVAQEFGFMRDLRESVRYNLRDPRQLPPDLIPPPGNIFAGSSSCDLH
jgi:hypothetical protein